MGETGSGILETSAFTTSFHILTPLLVGSTFGSFLPSRTCLYMNALNAERPSAMDDTMIFWSLIPSLISGKLA